MSDFPGFDTEYVFGTVQVSRQLLSDFCPVIRPTPSPTDWYQPLAPWRIARTIRTNAARVRERIADVAYVARHGLPERDDW